MMRRLLSMLALFAGFTLVMTPEAVALAGKKEDAAKHTATLKKGTTQDKVYALGELGKLGQIQKSFIADAEPTMIAALDDKDPAVRGAAAKAVGMIDPDAAEVLPKLRKMLADDKNESVKLAAAAGIASMGPAGSPAAPDLRKIMKDTEKKSKLNRAAMTALRSVMPKKK